MKSKLETDGKGNKIWRNEKRELHRDGGLPAWDWSDGTKEWWVNGQLHRDGGLPAVEWSDDHKEWWVNGKRHRDGGLPAVEWSSGRKEWWVNGKLHRDNGLPAVQWKCGYKAWWINGEEVTEAEAIEYSRYIKLKEIFGETINKKGEKQ